MGFSLIHTRLVLSLLGFGILVEGWDALSLYMGRVSNL